MSTAAAAVLPAAVTSDDRSDRLDAAVADYGRRGWRIVSRTGTQAQLSKGHRTNHVLHLILTILTLGVWAIVWILSAVLGGEKNVLVSVDDEGRIRETRQ